MIRRKNTFGGKRRDSELVVEVAPVAIVEKRELKKDELYLKDAAYEKLYSTIPSTLGCEGVHHKLHPQPMMLRLFKKDIFVGKHRVLIWNYYAHEWLSMVIKGDLIITSDLSQLPQAHRPKNPHELTSQTPGRVSTAHRFKRVKPIPAKTPADGKRVIIVTIGVVKGLYDVGDGSRVADIPTGVKAKDAAEKAKRKLVNRTECGEYAMHVLVEAWKEGRRVLKGLEKRAR